MAVLLKDDLARFLTYGRQQLQFYINLVITTPFTNLPSQLCKGGSRICERGADHGERAEGEPITGVWGRSLQRGPGAEPLVGDQGAKSPCSPEAESFFGHFYSKEGPNVKHLNEMI